MKKLIINGMACLFAASLIAGSDVSVRFVDDVGAPLSGMKCDLHFNTLTFYEDFYKQNLDKDGRCSVSSKNDFMSFIYIVEDPRYYRVCGDVLPEKTMNLEVVVPRKLNPIPLHALDFSMGVDKHYMIPGFNEWYGFDFEVGDWVHPHGKGKVADLKFKLRREFVRYWDNMTEAEARDYAKKGMFSEKPWSEEEFQDRLVDWRLFWDVAAVDAQGGIMRTPRIFKDAELRLPHSAPEAGYQPELHYGPSSPTALRPKENDKSGFFVRSRVKLDEKGQIVSANYAKIHGDFVMRADKGIHFCYYYNPTPNDRNLEFDTKRNLMPKSKAGQYTRYEP